MTPYCSSCLHADAGGILSPHITCEKDGAVYWEGHSCALHTPDTRSFAERFPDYVHMIGGPDPMARVIRERVANGAELVEIQPGLRIAVGAKEAA